METCAEATSYAIGGAARFHQQRTQSRTKGHGVYKRYAYRYSHCETELLVKRTRCATHETHRDKHGHKYDSGGNQSRRKSSHSRYGGCVGIALARFETCLHGLDHYHRVVDHGSDYEYYRKQGEHVECKPGGVYECKCARERYNDR